MSNSSRTSTYLKRSVKPNTGIADTIRILVATDNHVGYAEDDPIRGDDSWRTFDEVLALAKDRDADMVLLGGDLFHENKPSRKAMVHVMESLRKHTLGDKPCSLEMIGDQSEHFTGAFNHANYLDPNVNVSIPVFSIHGNHDDPSGEGHYAALDELQMSGLLNYYGRVPESDKIEVKPLLLQKGTTKLALYGLSNVRDERLFRTFRDQNVKFYRPGAMQNEWYSILSVHQNHVSHTETSWLPESFLPRFMDMVIWGHEHECLINPRPNAEMGFEVMQPGSSVATALMPGEAVAKHVGILSITGKERKFESIRLKTVRPFIYRDIALMDDAKMRDIARKDNNLPQVKKYCQDKVEQMIQEAQKEWLVTYRKENRHADPAMKAPLPLVRLRVEYTAPPGGDFKIEQTARFSKEYTGRIANTSDVFQFHRKRTVTARGKANKADLPDFDEEAIERLKKDSKGVQKLVEAHLTAQALTMLPRNLFGDAVIQYIDKNDKKALEHFVDDSLKLQVSSLKEEGADESDDAREARVERRMKEIQAEQEKRFEKGEIRARKSAATNLLPRPPGWDSDMEGHWADNAAAVAVDDAAADEDNAAWSDDDAASVAASAATAGGRAAARKAPAKKAPAKRAPVARAPAKKAPSKKAPATKTTTTRGRRAPIEEDDDDDDVIMLDNGDDSGGLFVSQAETPPTRAQSTRQAASHTNGLKSPTPSRSTSRTNGAGPRVLQQSRLAFGSQANERAGGRSTQSRAPVPQELSDDEIDDDDAFEPISKAPVRTARRR